MKLVIDIPEEDYNNIEPFLNGETIKGGLNLFKVLEIIKNGKPLPKGHWIPVSERLPEESGAYLVWMIWGDEEPTYSIINFDADYNEFGEWIEHYDINTLGFLDREFRTYIDVFAWCPLPQPYKAEGEDE